MWRWRSGTLIRACAGALLAAAAAVACWPTARAQTDPQADPQALTLDVDGPIGPAMADYVVGELRAVDPRETRLVVLRMNTPGGLDSSMRAIITAILASPTPVAAFVAPSGARAASAGTYIAYACAIAAMAPGANIGAATPVQLGGGPPQDTETRKIVNDAVAYIRGLAELNGRNADWAEQAVRSAVSIPASQALKLDVVNVIANNVPDLLRQIDGRQVVVAGKPQKLAVAGLAVVDRPPGLRTQLLGFVTNPNVAFLLALLGVAGLVFEFTTPGAVAPGVIGAFCLVAALLAFDLLPIDYAGVALVLLGVGLMIAEVHIGSLGLLGLAGAVAFAVGALIMFPTVPGFTLSRPLIAAVTVVAVAFFVLGLSLLRRSRLRPVVTGREALVGAEGEAISWARDEGRVRVLGEVWRARAASPLEAGRRVKVIGRQGLVLTVEPV